MMSSRCSWSFSVANKRARSIDRPTLLKRMMGLGILSARQRTWAIIGAGRQLVHTFTDVLL
jgi:hypothetical protein